MTSHGGRKAFSVLDELNVPSLRTRGKENDSAEDGSLCPSMSESFSIEKPPSEASEDDEATEGTKSLRDDPYYFDTDFEGNSKSSDMESIVDSIEYFARSFSGLSFLSDIGFEDLEDKEVGNIEEKVIEEYGIDYIKKYEKTLGNDEYDSETKSGEDRSGEESTSINENTIVTTAEILDDIINAEREGKEVVYDPKQKESRRELFPRKSLRINKSHSTPSFEKENSVEERNGIRNSEPEDALATRAAATALADSMFQGNNWQDQDNTVEGLDTGKNPDLKQRTSRYSYVDTDYISSDESDSAEQMKRLPIVVDTKKVRAESSIQCNGKEESIFNQTFSGSSSVNQKNSSSSLNLMDKELIKKKEEANKDIEVSFEEEGSETGSQYEHQNLEVINGPNGDFIRFPSYHGTPSINSSSTAYYDNKEVVYDPTIFGKSSRRHKNSCALLKKPNSCCDLREIATTLRPRTLEEKQKLEKLCSESVFSEASISQKPWKVIENGEDHHGSPSDERNLSYPPIQFEGVEMQLKNLDCFHVSSKKPNKKERTRSRSLNKRRFLDPERLFCGLKPQQKIPAAARKNGTQLAKVSKEKGQKANAPQSASAEITLDSIRVETKLQSREEESPTKGKAQNISMDTTLTAPSSDEDGLSQLQVETPKDPLISVLLEKHRPPSIEQRKRPHSRKMQKSHSRESLSGMTSENSCDSTLNIMDLTRISVTSGVQESDLAPYSVEETLADVSNPTITCPIPRVPEALPDSLSKAIPCQASETQDAQPHYGGELVDLLHQISSYVDGIVEKNNYSLSIPSMQARGESESKKDGNEADDEQSNTRSDALFESNSIVSAVSSSAAPSTAEILDAIYVPTKRSSETNVENQKKSQKDEENAQRKADLLSLFDNSPTRSVDSHSSHGKKSDLRGETPPRSLMDDDESEDSSAICGSSVERSVISSKQPHQLREEPRETWEENPVVYHMKSSPPQVKKAYRNFQKRNNLNRTVERHPLLSKNLTPKAKPTNKLVPKAEQLNKLSPKEKPIDSKENDDDDDSVGSLPYRCVTNAKPKAPLETMRVKEEIPQKLRPSQRNFLSKKGDLDINKGTTIQKGSPPSQQSPLQVEPTNRRSSHAYRTKRRPPTPPRTHQEELDAPKAGLELRSNVLPIAHKVSFDANETVDIQNKISTPSNGYVVDENGFLLDRTAALLENLDQNSSFPEDLERGSDSTALRSHDTKEKSVGGKPVLAREQQRENRFVTTGDRMRHFTKAQVTGSSSSYHPNAGDANSPFSVRKPASISIQAVPVQARNRAVHSRVSRR